MPYFEGTQKIQHWRSSPNPINAGIGTSNGTFYVAPIDVDGEPWPGLLQANSFAIAVSGNLTATSVSQQLSSTLKLGLYTRSGSTLNLINSASATFGNTNASNGNSSRWHGARFIQLTTGNWSSSPLFIPGQRYYIAVQLLSHITTGAQSFLNAVSAGTAYSGVIGAAAPAASQGPYSPFRGLFNATTSAVPTTIQASQLSATSSNMSFYPFIRIDEDFGLY